MLLRYLGSTDGAGGGGGAEETVIDKGVRTKLIGDQPKPKGLKTERAPHALVPA